MNAPNLPEQHLKKNMLRQLGKKSLEDFERQFRMNFIQESDISRIALLGLNCLRVPFHYRIVENAPYRYRSEGIAYLDRVVQWARRYHLWVILDFHGAPGCQNHDWHSDSYGKADLWKNKEYQHRSFALWEFVADRYKEEPQIAGYDLLNEAVLKDTRLLNRFYRQLIKRIRTVDRNHILFIEGNRWGIDMECLEEFDDDNHVLSAHSYEPLDFTFNFVPHLPYPLKTKGRIWNKAVIKKLLLRYKIISDRRSVPIFVGEFGVNYREGVYGEHRWVKDVLGCFKEFGFHWTYWTYKAIKNSQFPDGLYSYYENPPWVNRAGPVKGWDTYPVQWNIHRDQMIRSWHTDQFQENTHIIQVLRHAAR